MKESWHKITLAVSLVVALLCGMVLHHHHHHADGSMCLAVACHDCACQHQHDGHDCHGHQCPGHDCAEECGMHLDSFCCEQHDYLGVVQVSVQLVCDAIIPDFSLAEISLSSLVMLCGTPVRGVADGYRSAAALRAPPADNLC